MIYLKPSAGLCNRMRSIESALNLCEKYNKDLTILWVKSQSLNCDFHALFLPFKGTKVNVQIKEFDNSFINHYINKIKLLKNQKFGFFKYLIYHCKKYRHKINLDFKTTLLLWKIDIKNVILDKELRATYNSTQLVTSNINDLDNKFIQNTSLLFKKLFSSPEKVFIESCYRISSLNDITIFRPEEKLKKIITSVTEQFENTIGIHIRRSDHEEAIKISKTSYFIKKMQEYVTNDSSVKFFLATDDVETKRNLIKEFGTRIITNDVKNYDRNEKDAIQSALIDLYCLSKTKKILGSYHSTFSQMAAIIGKIECIIIN